MEERKQSFTLFGYRFFYVFLFCAVCYLCLAGHLPFRELTLLHLFILAALSAGLSAVDSLKGRGYLYGFSGFLVVYAIFLFGKKDVAEEQAVTSGRIILLELFYLMLLVLGIYLCHLLTERFVWIKRAAVVLLLGALVAAMICKWQVSHLGVAASLLYMAAVLAEYVESGWRKQRQGSAPAYLLWLLPFLAGYFILTAVMPYKDTPYDWAFFINLYQRAQRKVLMLTENMIHLGKEDFGISTTGFSEGSRFFGNTEKSDKVVMILDNSHHYTGSIYLTGKNYDSFDGRQWTQKKQGGEKDHDLDAMITLCAVYGYDPVYPGDYLKMRTVGVQYEHFHTGYLFAPVKTCRIKQEETKLPFRQQGGDFLFTKKQGLGTTYEVTYGQLNLGNPIFAELATSGGRRRTDGAAQDEGMQPDGTALDGSVQSEGAALDEDLRQEAFTRARRAASTIEDVSLADLDAYQERVKTDYTEAVSLSPEAEAFLREAVAGADTDYEKLLGLERALSSFAYEEKPGKLPGNVDTPEEFLDYFLVEHREGYCSYFASAFVLLARAEGIPARYVQGYAVPLAGKSSVEVTNRMAHAWAEAWLEGIGWVPFEPTPGFDTQRNLSWSPHKEAETPKAEEMEKAREEWREQKAASREPEEEVSAQELAEQLRAEQKERRRELLIFLGYLLALVLALGILLLLADALLERRRTAKRSVEEKFRIEALRDLQILAALGYRRQGTETLSELSGRLTEKKIKGVEPFIAVCEEVLYGSRLPDEKALAQLRRIREQFLDELYREKGRRYVFSRIGLYLMRVR